MYNMNRKKVYHTVSMCDGSKNHFTRYHEHSHLHGWRIVDNRIAENTWKRGTYSYVEISYTEGTQLTKHDTIIGVANG